MTGARPSSRGVASPAGFTLVELLIYLTVGLVVIGSVYQLLIGQSRQYVKQRDLMDVRSSLKATASLLAWELRQARAMSGDLYSTGPNSFAIRSLQGTGVICAEHPTEPRYALWATAGEFQGTSDDSALLFATGSTGADDDEWKVVAITGLYEPAAGGVSTCFWGDSLVGRGKGRTGGTGATAWTGNVAPDFVVQLTGNMDKVYMGAPVRAFRRVEYGLYEEGDRWWLGRKVGSAGSYEKVRGPLRPPWDSGLVFTYYDRAGNTTLDPAQVALVEIVMRAEGSVQGPDGMVQTRTLRTRVGLLE